MQQRAALLCCPFGVLKWKAGLPIWGALLVCPMCVQLRLDLST